MSLGGAWAARGGGRGRRGGRAWPGAGAGDGRGVIPASGRRGGRGHHRWRFQPAVRRRSGAWRLPTAGSALVPHRRDGGVGPLGVRVPATGPAPWGYYAWPGSVAGGRWAGFGTVHLAAGARVPLPGDGLEMVVVPLRGSVGVLGGAQRVIALEGRADVWSGPTDVAYLPPAVPGGGYVLCSGGQDADVAIGFAPGGPAAGPALRVPAADVVIEQRGEGSTVREVRHLYEGDRPAAHLLVVEVITPAGHWSSFPPHRHDEPEPLEEFYYCETRPRARHAYLHVFDDAEADGRVPAGSEQDEAVAVRHGDLVLVRRGYHTAACPPGTALYYLNIMAGPDRAWAPVFHPAYRDLVAGWERAPLARP